MISRVVETATAISSAISINSSGNTISGNTLEGFDANGIILGVVNTNRIVDNHITNCGGAAIRLKGEFNYLRGNTTLTSVLHRRLVAPLPDVERLQAVRRLEEKTALLV